ncbi:MAG TPA: glycosyltransferase family 2 protein [Candidatus Saccharimonadales bacterium]|nr:glycosyltransferase family 2 protein [Candidatus Saccharimonadales bacterium]
MKITIVIPAYNEEDGIGPTLDSIPIEALRTAGYEVEKLVVDNASSDLTAKIARAHGARVVYQPKRGYGNAYKAGFENAQGDIIATGDADTTYPFDALPEILAKLHAEDLDFITTNRLSKLYPRAMQPTHIFGNYVLSLTMRILFRTPFRDSQSGMWIFRRTVWQHLEVKHNGMPFSQEIKVEAFLKGFRCAEVPIVYRQRVGEVKLSVVDAWRTMSELFKKRLSASNARPELDTGSDSAG